MLRKVLPSPLVVALPLLIIIPNWNTSFFGGDFEFPYNGISDLMSPFRMWSDDYLGEENFNTYKGGLLLMAWLTRTLGGFFHAPHVYIFITLVLYLLSILLLTKRIRSLIATNMAEFNATFIDAVIVVFAFISPVVWGYFANYFTIDILLATVPIAFSLRELITFLHSNDEVALFKATGWTLFIAHPPMFFFFVGVATLLLVIRGRFYFAFVFLVLAILLSAFWIIPMALSFFSPTAVSMSADKEYIDHIFQWYGDSVNILLNGIFSIYPDNKLFLVVPVSVYQSLFFVAYIVILIALMELKTLLGVSRKTFHSIFMALLLVLAFSFGGKYATGGLFLYAWEHVSILHFFKSFTQILNVGFVLFVVLLAFGLSMCASSHRVITRFVPAFFGVFVLFILVVYTPALNAYIQRGTISHEYNYSQTIIDADSVESRILSLPEIPYEYYTWNPGWDQYFTSLTWFSKPVIYFGVITPVISHAIKPATNDYSHLFVDTNSRYLLIHHDYDDTKWTPTPFTFDYSLVYPIYDTKYFTLYKIRDQFFKERISAGVPVSFWHINNTRYQIFLDGLSSSTTLIMREKFDRGWKLVPSSADGECKNQNGVPTMLAGFLRTPLSEESHHIVDGYANAWTIDARQFKTGYSTKYVKRNQNGTISTCLTLYYRPQFYFPLALSTSVITAFVLLFLLFKWRHRIP